MVESTPIVEGRRDFFVSYTGADRRWAEWIACKVEELGYSVVIQAWDFRPGDDFVEKMHEAISGTERTILVLSPSYLESFFARKEWTAVFADANRPGSLLPIRIEPCDPPGLLKPIVYIDLVGLDEQAATEAIGQGLQPSGRPDEAPSFPGRRVVNEQERSFRGPVPFPTVDETPLEVTRPGLKRYLLDRTFPSSHRWLTRIGTLSKPPEMDDLHAYLRRVRSQIENDIREKTYLPLAAKTVPAIGLAEGSGDDPFVKPIHQVIRQVLGVAQGGDSASAQIAAVNRKSRMVRNILRTLLSTRDPLVLLGDPGTGKTMTMQQVALNLAESEISRVFPIVVVYVRLGEFHVEGPVGPEDVERYVRDSVPPEIRRRWRSLQVARRLVILFDGMDEMSRERYGEHTDALSVFAGERRGQSKTLFSCRITDFSPEFKHQRLVLLPFDRRQIAEYLRRTIPGFPIQVAGEGWSLRRLAKRLSRGDLPMDTTNPFVLWLLCFHLARKGEWPDSRVELLEFFNARNYERKLADALDSDHPDATAELEQLSMDEVFEEWGRFAFEITVRNRGAAIPIALLGAEQADEEDRPDLAPTIHAGTLCGVLVEALDEQEHLLRFEHHRFQEFFAARHIHRTRPSIDWLDKLDAPRWQETMLNVVLMGGGDEAVETLADSIARPIRAQLEEMARAEEESERRARERRLSLFDDEDDRIEAAQDVDEDDDDDDDEDEEEAEESNEAPPEPTFSESQESLIADRVELASRMIRQSDRVEAVRDHLVPTFHGAVAFLAKHGNPITQVKMLRACQNVPEADVIEALQTPLQSPINWVRSQALIMVASSQSGARAIGSDLATEIGYDLAKGRLLSRLPTYVKAARAAERRGSWLSLLAGAGCQLLHFGALLALAGVLCVAGLSWIRGWTQAEWLDRPVVFAVYAVLVVGSTILIWKQAPHWVWRGALGSGFGSLAIVALVLRGWQGSDDLFGEIMLGLWICAALVGTISLLACAIHQSSLAGYLLLTRVFRPRTSRVRSLFGIAWRINGYDEGALFLIPPLLLGAAMGGLFLLFLFLRFLWDHGLSAAIYWIGGVIPLPLHPLLNVATLLAVLLLGVFSRKLLALGRGLTLGGVGRGAAFTVGYVLFLAVMLGVLKLLELVPVGRIVAVVAVVVLLIGLLVVLGALLAELNRMLRGRTFPPRSLTTDQWRTMLSDARPAKQANILARTNYQSVGLGPEEFLEVLEDVERLISEDPALSTYWEQRDQLEQVLKQERRG